MVVGETDASRTANPLRTDNPTAATIVWVILGVHASTIAASLTRGAGVATGAAVAGRSQIGTGAMAAATTTALALRVTADAIRLAIGKGCTDAAQAEQTPHSGGGKGFEGMAA